MGNRQGRRVAAKVLRVYLTSDFSKIRRAGCLHIILAVSVGRLAATDTEILQGSNPVEGPQSSNQSAMVPEVDGKWEYQ